MTAPTLVYLLCVAASATCAVLLVRAYRRTRTRLLLWSALSFVCLAINNFFVVADLLLWPDTNLLAFRYGAALAAGAILIYGFIWEAE